MAPPLKPNPFTPNAPINNPARFSGRDIEIQAVVDGLFQTAHGNPRHLAVTGARGIGKTSVLNMAAEVAAGDRSLIDRIGIDTGDFRFRMLPVIHTANRGETVENVVNSLLRELQKAMHASGLKTTELHWEIDLKLFRVGGTVPPGVVPQVVDQLIETIEGAVAVLHARSYNGLLLMIDEVDRITRVARSQDSDELVHAGFGSFFKVLSEKLARRGLNDVGVFLCGVDGFIEQLVAEHPSVDRVFRPVPIPPLTSSQAEQIVIRALATVAVDSTDTARRRIVRLSGFYPEPVHVIGEQAFDVDRDECIDDHDVEEALDRVVRYVRRNYLRGILAKTGSGRDRDILKGLAEIPGESKPVSEVAKRLGLEGYQFSSNMTRLTRKDVLIREKQGVYRFREPLLEIYIKRVGLSRGGGGGGEEEEEEEEE